MVVYKTNLFFLITFRIATEQTKFRFWMGTIQTAMNENKEEEVNSRIVVFLQIVVVVFFFASYHLNFYIV